MFRTDFTPVPSEKKISLTSAIFSIGSCFAQVMGNKLQENKFQSYINPFGIIYNPASIFRLSHNAINCFYPSEHTYLVNKGIHFNYLFHSSFSATSKEKLQHQLEQVIVSAGESLKKANWLIVTLGTAFCYENKETGQLVTNCHKMPAATFNRRMLTVEEIVRRFDQVFFALNAYNPDLNYIFTVSPVRHTKNTIEKDSVSKAVLRLACEEIVQKYPHCVQYFPSYEIMMDDLRDYRFYQSDLIHPNDIAEDYIWQKFVDTYLDEESKNFLKDWKKVSKALKHKPFFPDSSEYQSFIHKTIARLQSLNSKVNVSNEIQMLRQQLL